MPRSRAPAPALSQGSGSGSGSGCSCSTRGTALAETTRCAVIAGLPESLVQTEPAIVRLSSTAVVSAATCSARSARSASRSIASPCAARCWAAASPAPAARSACRCQLILG